MALKVNFKIKLTKKQQEVADYCRNQKVREIVMLFSRQSGKSTIAEIMMMSTAIKAKYATVFYISPSYSQGKKIFREICTCLEPHGLITKKNSSNLTIELFNHSIIQFFTSKSPEAIRGNTCKNLLVIDEEAFVAENTPSGDNFYYNVVMPITKAHNPKILHISTPSGKQGLFYEKYLEAKKGDNIKIRLVESTIYDDELISSEEIEELKRNTPPMSFAQEFECKFLDSSLTAIEGFENVFVKDDLLKQNSKVWIGIDLSSVGDDETIVTYVDSDGHIRQHKIDGELDDKYRKIAEHIDNAQNLQGVYIETNSIGEPMLNEIKKLVKKNKSKVKGWNTTNSSKKEIIGLLQTKVANKEISIPNSNKDLYQQFGVFTYTITKNKTVTFGAKSGYHDDRVMSLAIALRAKEDIVGMSGEQVKIVSGRKIRRLQ